MTILLFLVSSCDTTDDYRGEWILVLEADIVLTNDRERLEEVLTVDTDDVFLSFYRSRDADTTGTDLSISSRYLDDSFMLGADTSVVVVLTRDEVGLLQRVDELRSHDG
jgi:glycosyltransferase involved in cell wall biosynthesis